MSGWRAILTGAAQGERAPPIPPHPPEPAAGPSIGGNGDIGGGADASRTPVAAPALDAFEERAAIAEHDGGLSREAAERLAAEAQGFADPAALHAAAVERWRLALDALALREASHRGREHVAHARAFVAGGWAAQAAALGWTELELFGLCPAAPWARFDRMGAAWFGDAAAVTAEHIAYRGTGPRPMRLWRGGRADGARVPW